MRLPHQVLTLLALTAAFCGEVRSQDPVRLDRLVADLCGQRPKRRAPAAARLRAHPDAAAVVAALLDVLAEPRGEPPMQTAVGIGGDEPFKVTRSFDRPYAPRQPAPPPELICHELDLLFADWPRQALAAWMLGELGEPARAALGGLIEVLGSEHVSVRDNATATLLKLGAPAAAILATHTGERARALARFPSTSIPMSTLVAWLEGDSADRCDLALHLCASWRVATPQMCDLMLRRVEQFRQTAALTSLELCVPTSVPQLLRLFDQRSSKDQQAVARRAIFALRGLDWSDANLPRDAICERLLGVVASAVLDPGSDAKPSIDDAFLALRVLGESPALDADQRAALATRMRAACRDAEPLWRKLGFCYLGQFARDASDEALAREHLTDPYDDVAWAAAIAIARLGGRIDDAVLLRLCQSRDVEVTRPYLRAHLREHRAASLAVCTQEAATRPSELLDVLLAAARGDGAALVSMPKQRPRSADVRELAADLLRDLEPLSADRIAQLTAAARGVVGKHILVAATEACPITERLPLLRGALQLGAKRAAVERSWLEDADVWQAADALLHAALDALAVSDAATLAAQRDMLEPLLKLDNYRLRRRAIEVLTR